MKRLTTLTLLTFAALPVALLTNTNAIAQDDDAVTEDVVVVGTRGDARSPLDSAVPVDLINYFGHLSYDVLSPIGMNGAYFYIRAQYDY